MIIFGDSLSDNDNIFNAAMWRFPNPNSWTHGRFSNGKVWSEYLAEDIHLPLLNWAVGGAPSTEVYPIMPDIRSQLASWQEYAAAAPQYDISQSLFIVWIGANDIITYNTAVDKAFAAEKEALQLLLARGAKNIVVINLPDASRSPAVRGTGDAPRVSSEIAEYNRQLTVLVADLQRQYAGSVNLAMFDVRSYFDDLLDHPQKYGISNTTESCLNINRDKTTNYVQTFQHRPSCQAAQQFVFWDLIHPTTHTHRLLADKVRELILQKW
ncbi:MAG: SGNH/GDSL hydrolase family protein [Enterobacteriaceae bacterium]